MNVLGVVPATTRGESGAGVAATIHFQDWSIDGVPLRQALGATGADNPFEQMTLLVPDLKGGQHFVREYIDRIAGVVEPDLDDGRTSLLVCQLCADPSCGVVSASIEFDASSVTWHQFGWQYDYYDEETGVGGLDLWNPPTSFTFERAPYDALMDALRLQLTAPPKAQ
jgi:hypothetical protein